MNPGAKYSSDVWAILFITTLKPVGEWIDGTFAIKESVSSCWNTEGWLDLNYRKSGLDIFLNSSFNTFSRSHCKRQDSYDLLFKDKSVQANYAGDGYNSSKNGLVSVGFNNRFSSHGPVDAPYTFSRCSGLS